MNTTPEPTAPAPTPLTDGKVQWLNDALGNALISPEEASRFLADSARDLEREALYWKGVVRGARSELHEAGRLSDDEYAALASDRAARDYIDGLDAMQSTSAAQLAELHAISDALGTSEGHSSVEHIKVLRAILDQHAHKFKTLRDALGCDGSELATEPTASGQTIQKGGDESCPTLAYVQPTQGGIKSTTTDVNSASGSNAAGGVQSSVPAAAVAKVSMEDSK